MSKLSPMSAFWIPLSVPSQLIYLISGADANEDQILLSSATSKGKTDFLVCYKDTTYVIAYLRQPLQTLLISLSLSFSLSLSQPASAISRKAVCIVLPISLAISFIIRYKSCLLRF